MAASTLSEPGSKYGPCQRACGHSDCAAVREMAGAVCRICRVPIGYGIRFYGERTHPEGGTTYVHAVCLEEEVERAGPENDAPPTLLPPVILQEARGRINARLKAAERLQRGLEQIAAKGAEREGGPE